MAAPGIPCVGYTDVSMNPIYQPTFKGLVGPIYEGAGKMRYETLEEYKSQNFW